MINEIKEKKVKVGVLLAGIPLSTQNYEGIINSVSTLGGENFLIFEDGTMINMKYVQTIEIV